MSARPIAAPLPNEHLVAVWPPLGADARDHWNRRLSLFPGRSLSDAALTSEQAGRAGRLATYGQSRSAGVVQGLEVALEREGESRPRWFYRINAGQGLTAAGEDVAIPRELRVNVLDVEVCVPPALLQLSLTADEQPRVSTQLLPRTVGPSLGKLLEERDAVDASQLPELPRVGILLLQPVTLELVGNADPGDSCERDPANDAFEDWQLLDGSRLLWFAWPSEWHSLPRLDRRRRNRIAHTIFSAEAALGRDDLLPWEPYGVALGLVGFNRQWKPLFFDRYSVVRTGGAWRERSTLLSGPGRELARCRFKQFVEQLADATTQDPRMLARELRWLPPVGLLPTAALEPRAGIDHFFPSSWRTEATPVPIEELDAVLQPSAELAPFDLFARDEVEVLVPVDHAWYEPELLVHEQVDPIFQSTIDRFVIRRGRWLRRRLDLRDRLDALDRALGTATGWRATRSAAPLKTELNAIYDNNFDASVHAWSTLHGFTAGLWNHEDDGTHVGAICLPASAADVLVRSTAELNLPANNSDTDLAANRWAVAHGYVAGFWTHEPDGGTARVIAVKAAAAELRGVPLTELNAIFAGNRDVAAQRWALLQGFVGGAWNHEADATTAGVVCFIQPPPDADASDQTEFVASSGIDASDPELRDPEQDYGTTIGTAGTLVSIDLQNLRTQLRTGTPLRSDVSRAFFPQSTGFPPDVDKLPTTLRNRLSRDVAGEPYILFTGVMSDADHVALSRAATTVPELVTAIDLLYQRSHQNEVIELDRRGLTDFIAWLTQRVDEADDRVDFAFARVHTDIYRVRQNILGNDAATKLATSPALAMIAQGDSARATQADIESFVRNLKSQQAAAAPGGGGTLAAPGGTTNTGGATTGGTTPGAPGGATGGTTGGTPGLAPTGVRLTLKPLADRFSGSLALAPQVAQFSTAGSVGAALAGASLEGAATAGVTATALRAAADAARVLPPLPTRPDVEAVTAQSAIVGKALNFRTVSLAERLQQPVAPEAKDFGVSNKADVLQMLTQLAINVDDLEVPGFYKYVGDTLQTDTITVPNTNPPRTIVRPIERTFKVLEIAGRGLVTEVLQDRHDPDPTDGDEGAFFAAGVRSLENVVAVLRLVEGRIRAYRAVIDVCRGVLDTINGQRGAVNSRMGVLATALTEARQDVAIARALLDEERRRVGAVNKRRDDIVHNYVPYLAFRRPRVVDLTADAPGHRIDPGITEAPLPACLAEAVETPTGLSEMMTHMRDAPASWFPYVLPLIDQLDQPQLLIRTVQYAQVRASVNHDAQVALRAADQSLALEHDSVRRVLSAREDAAARTRAFTAQLDVGELATLSWANVRQRASDALSVGDLADGAHGRSAVARAASAEMENIGHVGGCLYRHFGEVRPAIRLAWAEILGQYDDAVSLRNLAVLPSWGDLELTDRRELQALVDWVYGRVDPANDDAQALISDFVRLCILLAAHAPVDRIVTAGVDQPTTVQPGARLSLTADELTARIGMHVLVYGPSSAGGGAREVVARGVVEDLGGGRAAARILETVTAAVNVASTSVVHLVSPTSPAAAFTPTPAPATPGATGGARLSVPGMRS